MRVLHLIDAAARQSHPTTCALLASSLGPGQLDGFEQTVALLGSQRFATMAQEVGVHDANVLSVPYGRALFGLPSIRRRLVRLMAGNGFDLIHCWSLGTFTLASLLFRGIPRAFTQCISLDRKATRWLGGLLGDGRGRGMVFPIGNALRREILTCGLPEDAVHTVRPAIDMAKINFDDRPILRKAWGVSKSGEKVIALLSDPPSKAPTVDALMATILANDTTLGDKLTLKLLVHPDYPHRQRAAEILRHADRGQHLILDERVEQPWRVLPGCDAVLNMESGGGGLSLLWAMAANVPIIGDATYNISEIIEDRHSGLLAQPHLIKSSSNRLFQLFSDDQLAWKLRDTARNEAYSFFSPNHYRHSLQTVYQQLIERQPINVPALPSTGGLRFSGRA
jgi:glycosyltransferase involved in cell wall biosynthesis